MKSMAFILISFFNVFSFAGSGWQKPAVEVEKTPHAKEQYMSDLWVQERVAEVFSKNFDNSVFVDPPRITSQRIDNEEGLDPSLYSTQNEIMMFLSQDWKWFCEVRSTVIWKLVEPAELVEGSLVPGKLYCYPRI